MRYEDGIKWLTVNRLIELLSVLPADNRVMVNAVGNLLVLDEDGKQIAYIDFAGDGSVESMVKW